MTAAITGVQKITDKPTSHTFGWARLWSELLDVPINHNNDIVDTVYLDHGVNFGGSLNLFGGWNDQWERRFFNLTQASKVYSLEIEMPDYASILAKRKDVNNPELVNAVYDMQNRAKTLRMTMPRHRRNKRQWLTVGDSHVAAWAKPKSMAVRQNGRTLYGEVARDFQPIRNTLKDADRGQLKGITIVLGNIDVRHHILRLGVDWKPLWTALKAFGDSLDYEVEYSIPWPVEFEGRKIPKTGYYKDRPFWGSQAERSDLVKQIRDFMDQNNMSKVTYPDFWYDLDPETYAKQCMEKPQSVHLSPVCYRSQNWGQPDD